MDKPGLVDWLIVPLRWLERAKGWRRLGLVALYAIGLLVFGVLGWRGLSLWRLPDIGDPFDLERSGTVAVADADNAMVLYRQAVAKLAKPEFVEDKKLGSPKAWDQLIWASADSEVRQWVVENRPAFAVWLEATERRDSLFIQPREMGQNQSSEVLVLLQIFARLARLEASRLLEAGDLDGAWKIHRATLRASRHVGMHGPAMQRYIGREILDKLGPDLKRWTDDPRIKADQLRRAIADLEACQAMTAPNSEMFRANYFAMLPHVERMGDLPRINANFEETENNWYDHWSIVPMTRQFMRREPDRSRRVLRLLTAGLLAQCDRPRASRPRLVNSRAIIFEVDSSTPPAVAAVPADELSSWFASSDYAGITGDMSFVFTKIDLEVALFDAYLIQMAERAYELEHAAKPKTYGDLVGPYLKALPEGIEAADPLASPTPAK